MQFKPLCLLPIAALMGGCVRNVPPSEQGGSSLAAEYEGAPEWVTGDCGSYFKNPEKVLCGTGSVNNVSSVSLARKAAEARARASLSESLQAEVSSLLRDVQHAESVGNGSSSRSYDDQYIENVSEQFSRQVLSGSKVQTTWISPTGTFWAMVSVNVETFLTALEDMETLNEAERRAIEMRAEEAFQHLHEAQQASQGR